MKKTELIVIVDRSGSMQANNYHIEMTNGINKFIKEQAKEKGKCKLTLTQFDNQFDIVHDGIPIKKAPKYELVPRASTALFDAVGRTIATAKERIKKDWLVVVLIVTDGMENASQEYSADMVRKLVEKQTKKGWIFTYLGANQDAFAEGAKMGMRVNSTANFTQNNTTKVYATASSKVSDLRSGVAHNLVYDSDERKDLTDPAA